MKRVAMFMDASLRLSPAGTYTPALVDLVQRLSMVHDITVFTVIPPTGETDTYRCGNADVFIVPAHYDDSIFQRAFRSTRRFMHAHRTKAFDLVHGFRATPGGMAALGSSKLAGIPSIVTLQGGEGACLPSIDYGNMARRSTKALTLWVCRHATVLTALTRFHAEAMAAHGLKRDVKIIPYGAADPFFCGPSARIPGSPIRILHVADLNPVKDQLTLLRAFQAISCKIDARLTIVGRDLLNGRIARLAGEMGIHDKVDFRGYIPHDDLAPLYFSADFLLHTSLYEAQGVVISEACAGGCVVCGTRVGLIADLEGVCTAAAPPGDFQLLANAVVALATEPARWQNLRNASRSWAAQHPSSWTAGVFSDLYEKVSNF